MPRAKGMVLTERDRALLGYLGVARYVTAAQVQSLIAPGHDKAIASRRLARLCERGPNPGDDAYLRRIEYRRTDALPFPVWTLTPRGRAVAGDSAPGPVAAVEPGASVQFVERVLALNEILLGLVLALRKSEAAPLSSLPFSWRVGADPLRFVTYDRALGRSRPALLRPDAILDVPSRRRRFFLEAETGSRGLAPAGPRDGHVTRRLSRYGTFFMGFADRAGDVGGDRERTWYRAAFPDGFDAEVIVLVQSEARRAHVERVIREYVGRSGHLHARALSFASAATELKPLVIAPAPPSPIPLTNVAALATPKVRRVAIDTGLAKRLDDGLNLFVTTYNAITRAARGHAAICPTRFMPDPGPAHELNAFRELLLHEILGYPRETHSSRKP